MKETENVCAGGRGAGVKVPPWPYGPHPLLQPFPVGAAGRSGRTASQASARRDATPQHPATRSPGFRVHRVRPGREHVSAHFQTGVGAGLQGGLRADGRATLGFPSKMAPRRGGGAAETANERCGWRPNEMGAAAVRLAVSTRRRPSAGGGRGGKGRARHTNRSALCLGMLRLAAPVGAVRVVGGERGSVGDGVNPHAPPTPARPTRRAAPVSSGGTQPAGPSSAVRVGQTHCRQPICGGDPRVPPGGVRDGRVFTLAADSLYCPSFCFRIIAISYSPHPHPPGRHSITTSQTASMPSVPPPHCRYGPHRSGSVGDRGGGRGREGQGEGKRLAGVRGGEQLSRPGTVAAGEPRKRNGRCRDPRRGPLEGASLRNGNEPLTADRSAPDEILDWAPKIHPGWRGGRPTRSGTRSLRTHHPR